MNLKEEHIYGIFLVSWLVCFVLCHDIVNSNKVKYDICLSNNHIRREPERDTYHLFSVKKIPVGSRVRPMIPC